jgi:hypothetical protein
MQPFEWWDGNYFCCSHSDHITIDSITQALQEIADGSQFAFYDLDFNEKEENVLSNFQINEFHNIVLYPSIHDNLVDQLSETLENLGDSQEINIISSAISRIFMNILSATGYNKSEIIIRLEPVAEPNDKNCTYWHIDKSHEEIAISCEDCEAPVLDSKVQNLFILPLKGESTSFYFAQKQLRQSFLKVANQTAFYYGHNTSEGCSENDPINILFDLNQAKSASFGFGSVHKVGINGTIHAAPYKVNSSRLIVLITPF